MGITGLLPFLKKASKNTHARHFGGYTAAVDGHGWLHKGAFGCAVKLGMGEATDAYVVYFMKYVNTLLENGIRPLIVFDGRNPPAKDGTNEKRRKMRTECRKKAQDLMRKGNKKEAWEYFVKSISVTHEMVHDVIEVLRQKHIDYVVAPYEADAQLAYLALKGYADVVVTEDSDLVLFGCPKILFKLKMGGECVLFDSSKIHLCMGVPAVKFQFERFRQMCILSGCDYLESLPGIGLTRAKKVINGMTSQDIVKAIEQIPSTLNLDIEVTDEYIRGFLEAEQSFLYHLVFDPVLRKVVPLNPYHEVSPLPENMAFCGVYDLSEENWFGLAVGSIHTKTLKRVDNYDMDKDKGYRNKHLSIWSKSYFKEDVQNHGKDLVKNTKHSSTKGLFATVSIKTIDKKRPIVSNEQKPPVADPSDKELLSMYSGDPGEADDPEVNSDNRRSKRVKRGSLLSTDTYSLRAERNDFAEDNPDSGRENSCGSKEGSPVTERRGLRKRKSNPFLKSPDIGLRARAKVMGKIPFMQDDSVNSDDTEGKTEGGELNGNDLSERTQPLCLIEKNHIYGFDQNIVVKSRYFRPSQSETVSSGALDSTPDGSSASQLVASSQISIYSVDKDNFYSPETQNLDELLGEDLPSKSDNEKDDNPDVTDENDEAESSPTVDTLKSVDIVTVEDDTEESSFYASSYFNNNKTDALKNANTPASNKKSPRFSPFTNNTSAKKAVSKPGSAGKLAGKCRSQGLKRGKADSSQKSLVHYFGYQTKAKI